MNQQTEFAKVISASRRIDLAGAFPDRFIELLKEKAPPENTHTLVIWTKNPANLLHYSLLRNELKKYESIFLHLTVTGMGGTLLEPKAPKPEQVLASLKKVVDSVGGGSHVRLRFDPVVHICMNDGRNYTNLLQYPKIARAASESGITNVSISWMQIYRKVEKNLKANGMAPMQIPDAQILEEMAFLQNVSSEFGLTLHGCCVPLMPRSRCIDGFLLQEIHPRKLPCSTVRAKGQRELCGCTESFDIGWYEPCRHGCVYCYANPMIKQP